MKPRTPGFWLIVATVGLLALLPLQALAGMSPEEVKTFTETKAKAEKGDLEAHFNLAACYARGWGVAQDQAEAVKWIRKAADKGYPMAQFSLGNCYDNGNGVTKNAVEAAKWMRKAADQGFANAQNSLAAYYANGKGVAMSQVEAAKWMRKAADQGDALAQYNLGNSYHLGRGVPKDAVEAVKWYRKAAEQGDAPAQFNLGNSYATGDGVAKDQVEAAKWYRKAAEQGHAEAAKSLNLMNRKTPGKGTPPTETTVTTLDGVRVVITKKGNVTNVETVGNLSPNTALTGSTLAEIKPENNPVDLLVRAVELFPQNHRAAYQLGLAARLRAQFDQKRVSDQSAHQAFSVLTMQPANERVLSWGGGSQTIGAEDHRAVLIWARKSGPPTYHPAWMIQHGMGAFGASSRAGAGLNAGFVAASAWSQVLDDYAKFIDTPSFWVTRHERNNPANFPTLLKGMESRFLSELGAGPAGEVGRKKLRAIVVSFDLKAADPALALLDARDAMQAIVSAPNSAVPANGEVKTFEDYRAKAEQGQAEAQYYLGMIYRTGSHGMGKDVPVSVTWLTKSAEQGHSKAQYYLGRTYFDFDGNTSGVAKDTRNAVSWWGKAAAQGDADAQEALGFCYAKGFGGLVKNEIEAYAYQILASRSNASAVASRGKLETSLSPESLRAGVARSKALQAAIVVTANSAAPASGVKAPPVEVNSPKDLKAKTAKGGRSSELAAISELKAAETGSARAQYQMGARYYMGGAGITKDDVEAVKWWLMAAGREGDPDQWNIMAKYRLGFMHEKGRGVAVGVVEAARWWRRAAEIGHAGARFSIGYCYQVGQGVPKDAAEAAKWFRLSAVQGNREAQLWLARAYLSGAGVPKDPLEAYAYLSLASQTKSEDADKLLASVSERMTPEERLLGQQRSKKIPTSPSGVHGREILPAGYLGGIQRTTQNVAQFESVRARAEQGDNNAQSQLATYYQRNEVVLKDDFEAEKWLRKSAAQGNTHAAEELEKALKPAKEAAEFKALLATADQADPSVQNKLGLCYLNGKGVKRDFAVAAGWFRKAADQGNANAQYNLGTCYRSGWGVSVDQAESISLFRKAAENGDAKGQYELGSCYRSGIGMPKDQVQADMWLGKAAAQNLAAYRKDAEDGDSAAQFNLGQSYRDGKGVARDPNEAVKWYRKSALQGNAKALFMMGNSYLNGEGVAIDKVEAIAYWELASPNDLSARQSLGFLKQVTLPLTVWQGERRARALQKEIEVNIAAKNPSSRPANAAPSVAGMAPEEIKAFEAYKTLAEKGGPTDQLNLGFCYAYGAGVAKDETIAVSWFRKAADQWSPAAQFQMGLCYAEGAGVTKDEVEACAYWNLIKTTYPPARELLASLETKMTAVARTRGQKRADELVKENEARQVGKPLSYADEYRASERERLSNPRNLKVLLEAEVEHAAASPYMKSLGYTGPGRRKELQAIVQTFDFTSDGVAARYQVARQQMFQITMVLQREWENGFVKERERESAEAMIKARQGDAAAQFVIGKGYYRTSKTRDYENALKWLLKSAEQGNRQAQAELGEYYLDMLRPSTSPEQAKIESAKWYRVAAEAGDAKAQYGLSRVYNVPKYSKSTSTETAECLKWLRLSAAQGYVPAQIDLWHKLSHTYRNEGGVTTTIKQEADESLSWSSKLAERGDIVAMREQATAYHNGKYVPKDEAAALKWNRMAAEAGDEQMQGLLWSLYSTGKATYFDPVPVDDVEAMKWCRILAANRNAEAIYAIGDCYAEGRGVPQSNVEAYAYWTASLLRWGSDPGGNQTEPAKRLELRAKMSATDLAAAQKRSGEILTDFEINRMKKQAQLDAKQLQQRLDYR